MSIIQLLSQSPVIPMVTLQRLEDAAPLAQALYKGGVRVIEVMLRTEVAIPGLQAMQQACPELTIGVGNVLEQEQLHLAKNAGAAFAASPGFWVELLQLASVLELPFVPGVMTVSEMMHARELKIKLLNYFPAQAAGGENFLRAMQSVFSDLKFMASGGLHAQNLQYYLSLSNVLAVGGTWLAPADLIVAKDWNAITEIAAATMEKATRLD